MSEKILITQNLLSMAQEVNNIVSSLEKAQKIYSTSLAIPGYGALWVCYEGCAKYYTGEYSGECSTPFTSYASAFMKDINILISYYNTLSQYITYCYNKFTDEDEKTAKQIDELINYLEEQN